MGKTEEIYNQWERDIDKFLSKEIVKVIERRVVKNIIKRLKIDYDIKD